MFAADYNGNNTTLSPDEWLVQDGVAKLSLLWNLWWAVAEAGADPATFGGVDSPAYKHAMNLRKRIANSIRPKAKDRERALAKTRQDPSDRTHAWPELVLKKTGREDILREGKLRTDPLVSVCFPRRSREWKSHYSDLGNQKTLRAHAAKESISKFLEDFTHAWTRVNGFYLPKHQFAAFENTHLGNHKKDVANQYEFDAELVAVTFSSSASKEFQGLLRMFWGSVGTDHLLRLERTTWARIRAGENLTFFQLIDASDKSPAASPLPIGLLVRWGRLLQFGPDLQETCRVHEVEACELNSSRGAVWNAFCGVKSVETAPDETHLRGRSLQQFADALRDLIESEDQPSQSKHGHVVIPSANGLPAKKAPQAQQPSAEPKGSEAPPSAAVRPFWVRQNSAPPGQPLSITLGTQGPPFSIRSLAYQFPSNLPEMPARAVVKQLILAIDLECDDFDLSTAKCRGLEVTQRASNGKSRYVDLSYPDKTSFPKDTNLCAAGHLDLGAPLITETTSGEVSVYFDPQHLAIDSSENRIVPFSPAETLESGESQALIEITHYLRSNNNQGFPRIGTSDFTIEPAP